MKEDGLRNNFNIKIPYKVVAVNNNNNEVKYKITQPLKLWLFGLTKKYYPVTCWFLRQRYASVIYFKNKKQVDDFILKEKTKSDKIESISEVIVFDSLNE